MKPDSDHPTNLLQRTRIDPVADIEALGNEVPTLEEVRQVLQGGDRGFVEGQAVGANQAS